MLMSGNSYYWAAVYVKMLHLSSMFCFCLLYGHSVIAVISIKSNSEGGLNIKSIHMDTSLS
jgi:ABC-type uncharacterized transport system permease subunit